MFIYKMSIGWCLSWCAMQELYLDVYSHLYVVSKMNLMRWNDTHTHTHQRGQSLAYKICCFLLRKTQGRFCTHVLYLLLWIWHLLLSLLLSLLILSDINIRWTIFFCIDLRSDIRVLPTSETIRKIHRETICIHISFGISGVQHITYCSLLFDSEPIKLSWLHYIRINKINL